MPTQEPMPTISSTPIYLPTSKHPLMNPSHLTNPTSLNEPTQGSCTLMPSQLIQNQQSLPLYQLNLQSYQHFPTKSLSTTPPQLAPQSKNPINLPTTFQHLHVIVPVVSTITRKQFKPTEPPTVTYLELIKRTRTQTLTQELIERTLTQNRLGYSVFRESKL